MEREQEIRKLVTVLRRTARMALRPECVEGGQDAAGFCTGQYNRVLVRLGEIDESVGAVFQPLPPGSSLTVAGMACRQLAAYYEDEVGATWNWGGACESGFDADAVRDFWRKSARDLEDLGECIRQSIEEWTRQCKSKPKEESASGG